MAILEDDVKEKQFKKFKKLDEASRNSRATPGRTSKTSNKNEHSVTEEEYKQAIEVICRAVRENPSARAVWSDRIATACPDVLFSLIDGACDRVADACTIYETSTQEEANDLSVIVDLKDGSTSIVKNRKNLAQFLDKKIRKGSWRFGRIRPSNNTRKVYLGHFEQLGYLGPPEHLELGTIYL